jgi:hypothetical protein
LHARLAAMDLLGGGCGRAACRANIGVHDQLDPDVVAAAVGNVALTVSYFDCDGAAGLSC